MKKFNLWMAIFSLFFLFISAACSDDGSTDKREGKDIIVDEDSDDTGTSGLSGDIKDEDAPDGSGGGDSEVTVDLNPDDDQIGDPIPGNPKCYTPCKSDFVKSDGSFIKCSSEKLMKGCFFGTKCVNGTCINPETPFRNGGTEQGTCEEESDCPDYQTCIGGRCYSNCEKESDCDDSSKCHRKVCRTKCDVNSDSCEKKLYCATTDGNNGVCMPLTQSADIDEGAGGTFKIDKNLISVSNVKTEASFKIFNKSSIGREFIIKKTKHSYKDSDGIHTVKTGAMKWILIGEAGSESDQNEFSVFIEAGENISIGIKDTGTNELGRWNGVVSVTNDKMGSKDVNISFAAVPEGQWIGKMQYFANFGDKDLFEYGDGDKNGWFYNKNDFGTKLTKVGNAFIQKWGNFRNGKISYDEISAAIVSMTTGSWNWKSTRDICPEGKACFLYDNSKGYIIFTSDETKQPVPSGLSELPFGINLKKGTTDKQFVGRVDTGTALHYFGNPAVSLEYEDNPADGGCSVSANGGDCLIYLKNFDFTAFVGGRYKTDDNPGSCPADQFKHFRIPWLVEGFTKGTYAQESNRYRYECRQKTTPLDTADAKNIDINTNVASANPVPDGKYRKRKISLIDGVLVNQEIIYIIFRESFDSFLGNDEEGFSSYGLITLKRSSTTLKEEDYLGSSVEPLSNLNRDLLKSTCSSDILSKMDYQEINESNAQEAMLTLIDGIAAVDDDFLITGEKAYYLCKDTGLFNGAKYNGEVVPCQDGSEVEYFILDNDYPLDEHKCNDSFKVGEHGKIETRGSCDSILKEMQDKGIRRNPIWRCKDENKVYCDTNRNDLLAEKKFYQESTNSPSFIPIAASIANGFKYKIRFASRSGKNIGFAPEICENESDMVPYCYNPDKIEEVESRTDCVVHIYDNYYDDLDAPAKEKIINFLKSSFAYSENGGKIYDGYEKLNSELLIMMGDEQYTRAFASRFDLAGSNIKTFEGTLFEPDGFDLSGGAGFELYSLYKAAQYYQAALDRFYTISQVIWKSLTGDLGSNFITQESVVTYFSKLIRASAQKSRVWSEVSKKYQSFNRPDLARLVVERAYTATYLESVIISQLMLKTIKVVPTTKRDQIRKSIDDAQLLFKAALLDMRDVYDNISDDITFLGFAPEYIPFPALDKGDTNAFDKLFASAEKKVDFARIKEQEALADNRSYETDAASFQSELVKVKNNYENELAALCGTMKGEDGKIYPAIPKYAHLNKKAKLIGNPCGFAGNGQIHEAMGEMELELYTYKTAKDGIDDYLELINIEVDRHNSFCKTNQELADYVHGKDIAQNTLNASIAAAQGALNTADRVYEWGKTTSELAKCSIIAGVAAGGDCPAAGVSVATYNGCFLAYATTAVVLEASIAGMEIAKNVVEMDTNKWVTEKECDFDKIESNSKIKEIELERQDAVIETMKIAYRLALTGSKIEKLRNRAKRVMVQQEESEQLLINVEAAKNDPNVRIYKNDAIINADRTFQSALRAAYKATKVYEYYTSQSYAKLSNLFLIRMISYGDYNLENYMFELEAAFEEFEEEYGNPDTRLAIISLRDDIMNIPRINDDGAALSESERTVLFRRQLQSTSVIDNNGYINIPFNTGLTELSPLPETTKSST